MLISLSISCSTITPYGRCVSITEPSARTVRLFHAITSSPSSAGKRDDLLRERAPSSDWEGGVLVESATYVATIRLENNRKYQGPWEVSYNHRDNSDKMRGLRTQTPEIGRAERSKLTLEMEMRNSFSGWKWRRGYEYAKSLSNDVSRRADETLQLMSHLCD